MVGKHNVMYHTQQFKVVIQGIELSVINILCEEREGREREREGEGDMELRSVLQAIECNETIIIRVYSRLYKYKTSLLAYSLLQFI